MVGTLAAWFRRTAVRRAIAAVCVLALLTVTFAHSLQHFDGLAGATGYQVGSVLASDEGPDGVKHASPSVEHCHGCVMTAVMSDMPSLQPPEATGLRPQLIADTRPSPPSFDNPPPIPAA